MKSFATVEKGDEHKMQPCRFLNLDLGTYLIKVSGPSYYKLTKNSKILWFDIYYERNTKNYFGGVNSWIKEKRPVEHT